MVAMSGEALLALKDLRTEFATEAGPVVAVDGVSLEIARGEIVGLVGESGSGKTATGYSILRLIDPPGRIAGGQVLFEGRDLLRLPEKAMRRIRGGDIAMIFQDPAMSLNPVLRVDTQMVEAVLAHDPVGRRAARARAADRLRTVGMPSPEQRLLAYPHQFSGGMRQRLGIATALLNQPKLIIADEPTTALDVSVQGQILHEVGRLCRETGTAALWITHDLATVSALADRVYVMYAGRIVESGAVDDVLLAPRHPYTRGLLDSIPNRNRRGQMLRQIDGMTPSLLNLPSGCAFRLRCPHAGAQCAADPPLHGGAGWQVRCWHPLAELAA
jgi:peptide/nickel transport system ATP-binding protein